MSLQQQAEKLGIRYFLVSYSDLFGTSRAKLVPAAAIDAMCEKGAGFAGFATWLDLTPADPDLFAIPDPASLTQLPWKPEIGWLAADLWMNDKPLPQSPRQVLKRSLAKAAERGYELRTGVECEFFLLTPDGLSPADLRDTQAKPCYDQQALTRRYDLISEICDALQVLGWEPYQNDHEDANGQFEINWKYEEALRTADQQTFFKFMVKTLAEKHGLRATFMPKPFSQLTGNGCHIHVSMWDRERHVNLFDNAEDGLGLTPLAYEFIGGVLHSAEALCAVLNPTVNSYRRIRAAVTSSGATWSPNTITYGGNNRTHMIRIPDSGRFELRLPDCAANPYLMTSAILEAGLDGIQHHRHPGPPLDVNVYQNQTRADDLKHLPDNLLDALRALESSPVLINGMGEEFVAAYLKLQRSQWQDFASHVSSWETLHTLDC
ncbi:type III glutamate--ammonia ligase [Planctomicrobium sp. SH661]|uniref:type III glutamate--ammonia ligase n=1 Tax=Planctomicrobium sp. SH661 TaxID=3448124 RepID=UPI003F5BE04E